MKTSHKITRIMLFLLPLLLIGCGQTANAPETTYFWSATPTATPTESPVPTPTPEPITAPDGCYTFAWMSDTQYYSRSFPDIFHEMTQFLASERERLNLVYVIHTGDLVNDYDSTYQWQIADHAMQQLGSIPYGCLAGNHDVHGTRAKYENFQKYFGDARFENAAYRLASYENNRGHADGIEAGDTSYLFVYLGYPLDEASMKWANGVFAAYPDRIGILCLHDYFGSDVVRTEQGQLAYDNIVTKNDNLYFVLCGHRYNSACVAQEIPKADGTMRTVYQMIVNYQASGKEGGLGYMRFLQVDEKAGEIRMYNYSPLLSDYRYYDEPEHRSENYAFDTAGEQQTIAIPWK